MEDEILYVDLMNGFQINWGVKNIGWGEFYFQPTAIDGDGKIYCSNEMMSKEFIKAILCKMVDDCILEEV